LVQFLPGLDKQRQLDKLGPADLQKALPAHSAFVDFQRYAREEFDPKKPGREGESRSACYAAFIVCPDRPIQRLELKDAEAIEAALADWRRRIDRRQEQDNFEPADKLRRLLWDKIARQLPA